MAEVKNIEDVYLEILNGTIIAYHSDNIDASVLPSGHTVQFAQVEDPATLLGLSTRYIDLDIKDRPVQNALPPQDVLRAQLRSLSIDIDLAERLKEDTTTLQTQFNELATQYNNSTPK